VIKHATEYADKDMDSLENVVVLIANTVMTDSSIIDAALLELETNPEIDSVMTVWEAADDHPYRAMEIRDGFLCPFGGGKRNVSTERQSYAKAYFYDQGVWAFRKYCV
jgi:N-acylneuraminate cytidylyltransferase